ncbi:MAG: hypothetical protein LH647_01035 [Leptolyngbyaceae cyanobacterium CAN_BIN12]|nr:hypothetical protein [Leptolyngbyaceae cyanobacterium CAN_BIN12]
MQQPMDEAIAPTDTLKEEAIATIILILNHPISSQSVYTAFGSITTISTNL